jgi:hypothetical protein
MRSITSRSLNGAVPDYRVLDTADAVVPQRIREAVAELWTDEVAVQNEYVSPDLPDGELPPEGTITPKLWATMVNGLLGTAETQNLLINVEANPATAEYNSSLHAIVSDVPTIVKPKNYQGTAVVRQIPAR